MDFAEFQKKRRAELMPSGEKLAKIAQQKCGFTLSQIRSDFNGCLKKLMDTEFKLYEQEEKECSQEIIKEAEKTQTSKENIISCQLF